MREGERGRPVPLHVAAPRRQGRAGDDHRGQGAPGLRQPRQPHGRVRRAHDQGQVLGDGALGGVDGHLRGARAARRRQGQLHGQGRDEGRRERQHDHRPRPRGHVARRPDRDRQQDGAGARRLEERVGVVQVEAWRERDFGRVDGGVQGRRGRQGDAALQAHRGARRATRSTKCTCRCPRST